MTLQVRTLGTTGLKVSAIGLGGNTFGGTADPEASAAIIRRALDLGITFIDTANSYNGGRSEEILGTVLGRRRREVALATKTGWPLSDSPFERGLSRRWLMQSIEDSLTRLRTDYVDLFQAHLPDADTPLEETVRAMDEIVRQGKARYIGCSNHAAWQVAHAHGIARQLGLHSWVTAQNLWNVVDGLDDPHLLAASRQLGFGLIPYTPLASGILTGKYRRGEEPPAGTRAAEAAYVRKSLTDAKLAKVERLANWCEPRGHTTTELAISWLLAFPEVSTVIVGARTPAQLASNLTALAWTLSPDERDAVTALAQQPAEA